MLYTIGDFTAFSDGKRSLNGNAGVVNGGIKHGMVDENFTCLRYLL